MASAMAREGLFGRRTELAKLTADLAAAASGSGTLVVVSGEPGVGKTRLVEELAHHAGASVAWTTGRAWESEGTPAYFPWLEALRQLAAAPAFSTVIEAARGDTPELAPFLTRSRGRSNPTPIDPTEARFRLFEAIADLLRACAEIRPIVVFLDDLHAADVASLLLLQFVARSLKGNARVLLVATMRDTAYAQGLGLDELLAKITREADALPLGRLDRADVTAWVSAALPKLADEATRVHAVSEGNPLFVAELLAAAKRRPGSTWGGTTEMPLGIREAIRAHLALLDGAALRVLSIASVLGRAFDRETVVSLVGTSIDDAIGAGIMGGIVGETPEGALRFRHALLRDELYARLAEGERRALHRAVAASERDRSIGAAHWLLGARDEDCARVLAAVHDAMTEGLRRAAFEDAATLGQRTLDRFASVLAPGDACDLGIVVATSWDRAGESDRARTAATKAAAIARTLDDTRRYARAALAHSLQVNLSIQDAPSVALLREAHQRLASPVDRASALLRARVASQFARALFPQQSPADLEEIHRLADEAFREARALGDDDTSFDVHRDLVHIISIVRGELERRFEIERDAIHLARKLDRAAEASEILVHHVGTHIERGDLSGAMHTCDALERLLAPLRQPHYRWQVPMCRAFLADLEGRFADSAAHEEAAFALIRDGSEFLGAAIFVANRMGALHLRGDDVGWAKIAADAERLMLEGPMQSIFWTMVASITGDREAVDRGFALLDAFPRELLPESWGLAFPCAEAGVVRHAAWLADSAAEAERTTSWPMGPGGIANLGPIALVRGRLAALLGRPDEALDHLRRARAVAERVRARPVLARVDFFLAELLATRDRAEARARAQASATLASELGMARVAAAATAILESLGPAPTPSARPARAEALTLVREGEGWRLSLGATSIVVRDGKGVVYLDVLLRAAGQEVHVLDLTGNGESGDAGPMLDERAKTEYRARIGALRLEVDDATEDNDLGRAERARTELEVLTAELARAVGLGGRDRRAGSVVERTRINVQRRLRDVVRRVTELDERLGRHLDENLRTGVYCSYVGR